MDPLDRIDQIIALIEGARSAPMSRSNCVLDRGEMINLLDELRGELPSELRRATALLEERDKIIDAGRREADRIIAEAENEHTRLVSVNEIDVIVKGVRVAGDFDYELQMAQMNIGLSGIETLFMPTNPQYSFVSSSLIKDVAKWGGDVTPHVPDVVAGRLRERFSVRRS